EETPAATKAAPLSKVSARRARGRDHGDREGSVATDGTQLLGIDIGANRVAAEQHPRPPAPLPGAGDLDPGETGAGGRIADLLTQGEQYVAVGVGRAHPGLEGVERLGQRRCLLLELARGVLVGRPEIAIE